MLNKAYHVPPREEWLLLSEAHPVTRCHQMAGLKRSRRSRTWWSAVLTAAIMLGSGPPLAAAEAVADVQLEGFLFCVVSALHEGAEHHSALIVVDDAGEQTRYDLEPNDTEKAFHRQGEFTTVKVGVTGRLTERDGHRSILASRIEPIRFVTPPAVNAEFVRLPRAKPAGPPVVLDLGNGLSIKCVSIPAGKFLMGSPVIEVPRYPEEFQHEVTLTRSFYLSETLITQAQFEALMERNPSVTKDPSHPVSHIPYSDILEFCGRLGQRTGRKVRLPTESEWEYACRCGSSEMYLGPEPYRDQVLPPRDVTRAVKLRAPNAWGLYDMLGSGWQACSDWFAYFDGAPVADPTGPARGEMRVAKGGWYADVLRPAIRYWYPASGNSSDKHFVPVFRVVVEAE